MRTARRRGSGSGREDPIPIIRPNILSDEEDEPIIIRRPPSGRGIPNRGERQIEEPPPRRERRPPLTGEREVLPLARGGSRGTPVRRGEVLPVRETEPVRERSRGAPVRRGEVEEVLPVRRGEVREPSPIRERSRGAPVRRGEVLPVRRGEVIPVRKGEV